MKRDEALRYIETLPNILATAYERARAGWAGNTLEMVRASYEVSEVVQEMWLRLSTAFPEKHFGGVVANDFLDEYVKGRYAWQHALAESGGPGTGGTIVGVLTSRGVLGDLETIVVQTVCAIRGLADSTKDWNIWKERWDAAKLIDPSRKNRQSVEMASLMAVELERFAIECANLISNAEWGYSDGGEYAHLKIPKLVSTLPDSKWQYLDAGILSRVQQLPNEFRLAQLSIDGSWMVDPGETALKESYKNVGDCGLRAWSIAVDLRNKYALPDVDVTQLSWNFLDTLNEHHHDRAD
jgi:hypothetical protein